MDTLHARLLAVVAVLTVAAVVGMVVLWPGRPPQPATAPTPLVDGVVRSAQVVECPSEALVPVRPPCVRAEIEVLEGPGAGATVDVDTGEQGYPAFEVGDHVRVGDSTPPGGEPSYYVQDYARLGPLTLLLGLFVVAVLGVGRWHGLRSLLGLGCSLLVITKFVIPAILAGASPLAVALVGSFVVMLLTLYLCHGLNLKTTTALVGTAAALCLIAVLGVAFSELAKVTGLSSEEAQFVSLTVEGLNLRGLVLAGLIIGALGVLDDVTVSQASTVFAVHEADPEQGWATLFRRAMGVGRDHIASVVNTLVLAYAGASIPLLILFSTSGVAVSEIVNGEFVAQEVVKTLIGSIGLVAAVPLTTALAAGIATAAPRPPRPPRRQGRRRAAKADAVEEEDRWLRALRADEPLEGYGRDTQV
ncbi:MAG: YibE/F family protein [Actinomycetota bacterium]|jgi:uncharacterized membrane protein|nr:YibE/F family protein [Euzebyaceae bacterium]MDQ3453870.1 YibE/F family protein [Actinomycetota bacterium]